MNKKAANLMWAAALAAALSLGACQRQEDELAAIDNEIAGKNADPALTSALEDQILVDPALTQQSNRNAVRPPETPTQAQYPLAEDASAAVAAKDDCASALRNDAAWASRIQAPFAPVVGARITEAVGSDRPGCRARIVTFEAGAAPERLIEHYRRQAAAAGFSAERRVRQGDLILAGKKGAEAYYLILTPKPDGSSAAALIVSEG